MSTNLRTHLRVNLPPGYRASFESDGRAFRDVRLLNLGCGGVCLELESWQAGTLARGARVASLVLHHPTLPDRPQEGQVIWRMGTRAHPMKPDSGKVLLGVRFLKAAPEFQFRILEFVSEHLGIQGVA